MNNRNPKYKDSPLGKIPSDWDVKMLGDICKFNQGVQIPQSLQKKNNEEGFIRYLYIRDFFSDDIKWFVKNEFPNKIISKRDIIMVNTGSTSGMVYFGVVGILSNNAFRITFNKTIFRDYLYSFLSNPDTQLRIKKLFNSGGQPHMGHKNVARIHIPIPPLSEQKIIAKVLSLMDSAISINNQLIAKKELQKKWLMQKLLTGKRRLKRFKEDWKEMHIKDVSREISIRNKADNQLTVLSCTKYNGLIPSMEYFGRKIFSDDVSTYKVVPKNHFAYATNHIEEGSIGYQVTFNEALISPMYTVFKTDSSINDVFFYKLLKSHKLVYQYQNRMEGSIDRRGGLRWAAFSIIKVKIPSYEEQSAIAKVLQIADTEIQLLKTKIEKLREQKKGLMQVLLTGKKRINTK